MRDLLKAWQKAFQRYHPEITFADTLNGSGTGRAGIITGVSELSLMGRPATANEIMGFEWVHRSKPTAIPVVIGAPSPLRAPVDEKSRPLLVYVAKENPLEQISMAQLKALLECRNEVAAWGLAGAGGDWTARPAHAYLYDSETGTGAFLQHAILGSEDKWNWHVVKEFKDETHPNGSLYPAAQQILEALANDFYGIAISAMQLDDSRLKVLPVSGEGPAVFATPESLRSGTYPFGRIVYIYINRASGKLLDPKVKEFLRFVLSEEGQRLVQTQGDFLPLPATVARDSLRLLD